MSFRFYLLKDRGLHQQQWEGRGGSENPKYSITYVEDGP